MNLVPLDAAELHQTQQEHRGFAGRNLALQVLANGGYCGFSVQIVGYLIYAAHIAVEVEIAVNIADSIVMTQVVHEHLFCPCLVNLLFLAKQGKEAKETREYQVVHLFTFRAYAHITAY